MGRGVSELISDQSGNKCYGSVNPSATADYLSENINNIIGDEQPEIVCLMAGTYNIGNGERPKSVIRKIDNLVSAVIKKCPDAKVIVSGVLHRQDNPHLNKTIDNVNHVLQTSAKRHAKFVFVNHNAILSSNRESQLKRDGLHLNMPDKKLIAKNIVAAFNQRHESFHNGHMKIKG